jgi:asparagine synthase (glutamine-hydrolysing)
MAMCGIAGIVERDGRRAAHRDAMPGMLAALGHRGPDGAGIHGDGPAVLGHTRLAIVDPGTGGQPMSNEDESLWLVFNGEIYNHRELRDELASRHAFRTRSDTEVILHLYEELGKACLERLDGMFSFALWDARRQRLFAGRDRLGIKPFYWHLDSRRFSFASEPKALIAGGLVEPALDREGLDQYLTFQFCCGPRTLFRDVWRLEPGHYLTWRPGVDAAPVVRRYWAPTYEGGPPRSEAEHAGELRRLLEDAVRRQLRSDVPVGAHLSGGIDSSAIVCVAAPMCGGRVPVFTGAFDGGLRYDETRYARAVAEHVGAVYHEVRPTADEFAAAVPHLIYMMDEPAAGPGLFAQYRVARLAREHVKVVLSGQGGDELFGGYARYLAACLEQRLGQDVGAVPAAGADAATWEAILPSLAALRGYEPLLREFWRDGLFEDPERRYFRLVSRADGMERLLLPDVYGRHAKDRMLATLREVMDEAPCRSYLTRMTHFDLRMSLPALLHVEDRMSMSASVETRLPLLDHRIVELVTRAPSAIRFAGLGTKRLLREAVRPLLPEPVLKRQDKMGFPVPLTEWLRGPLRDFAGDVLLGERARQRGLYRPDGVERLIRGERAFGRQLWGLLSLELWFRAFLDGERRPRHQATALPSGSSSP